MFMGMNTSTITIFASRKHGSLHALRHLYSNDLLMVLIHTESILCGPFQGLKCGMSHTAPRQSPVPWGAAAGPASMAKQGLHPMSCTPAATWRGASFQAQVKPSLLAIRAKLPLGKCLVQDFYQFQKQKQRTV